MWDYLTTATPVIQVIEATPKTSPCPSERCHTKVNESAHVSTGQRRRRKPQKSLSEQDSFDLIAVHPDAYRTQPHYYDEFEEDEMAETAALAQQINKLSRDNRCLDDSIITSTVNNTLKTSLLLDRRAPLASLSSLKISSVDYQDSDLHSLGSDSVFGTRYADTDDDMEQFSTDSDAISDNGQQGPLRPSKAIAHRSSVVCVDIELKPRESLANESTEKPKSFSTTAKAQKDKDCKLPQLLTYGMPHGNENGSDSHTILQPVILTQQKRPASCAGLIKDDGARSCSSTSQTYDNVNNNNKIKQLFLSSGTNNNTRCSKSTGNMAEEILHQQPSQQPHSSFPTFSSSILPSSIQDSAPSAQSSHHPKEHLCYYQMDVESVRKMPNQSPVAAQNVQSADDIVNSISNFSQRQSSSIVNPSVILELPVIVSTLDSNIIETESTTFDPSLPGPSRKWSKETLF